MRTTGPKQRRLSGPKAAGGSIGAAGTKRDPARSSSRQSSLAEANTNPCVRRPEPTSTRTETEHHQEGILKILVTVKRVEDYESKIKVRPDNTWIVTEGVNYRANPF